MSRHPLRREVDFCEAKRRRERKRKTTPQSAAEHLINSDDTISEISDRNGFSAALYFSRMFRKNYGMSPREYRSAYRK